VLSRTELDAVLAAERAEGSADPEPDSQGA
jgi:hypothetical protein